MLSGAKLAGFWWEKPESELILMKNDNDCNLHLYCHCGLLGECN